MKKIALIVLVLFLMLTLAACSQRADVPAQAPEPPATLSEEAPDNIEQITLCEEEPNVAEEEPDAHCEEYADLYTSAHTATTGILADPQRPFVEISAAINAGWSPELEALTWDERTLSLEDAQMVHYILSTMDAVEVLTPTHREGQHADPKFLIIIQYEDDSVETVYSVWDGGAFFRFTGTYGSSGDPGYVIGRSEALLTFLGDYF